MCSSDCLGSELLLRILNNLRVVYSLYTRISLSLSLSLLIAPLKYTNQIPQLVFTSNCRILGRVRNRLCLFLIKSPAFILQNRVLSLKIVHPSTDNKKIYLCFRGPFFRGFFFPGTIFPGFIFIIFEHIRNSGFQHI